MSEKQTASRLRTDSFYEYVTSECDVAGDEDDNEDTLTTNGINFVNSGDGDGDGHNGDYHGATSDDDVESNFATVSLGKSSVKSRRLAKQMLRSPSKISARSSVAGSLLSGRSKQTKQSNGTVNKQVLKLGISKDDLLELGTPKEGSPNKGIPSDG